MTRASLTAELRKLVLVLLLVVPVVSVIMAGRAAFATAGACAAPSTDYGTVTDAVSVPATGTYRIWTRMSVPSTSASTFMLEIDGNNCYTIGGSTIPTYASGATTFFASGSTNWTSKTSAGTQMDVSLASGNHTFKLIGNAAGVVVDRLVLTQDTACVPTGTGDNCANPPDTTAPVVSITSPASGTDISATTTVTANATDDVAVGKVEFYVDGTLKGTDSTGSSNNYTYSFNPASFSLGSHTLTAKAYDSSNNTATSSSVTVTVTDGTAPAVSVTAPTAGATVSGSVNLAATATDNVAVGKVEFYVDGTLKGTDTTGSSNSYSISLDTTSLSNASHSITAKAYDTANNSATSSAVSVTVNNPVTPPPDTTPPTVSVTAPTAGATVSGSVSVTATAADASGITSVAFYVDGTLKNTDTVAPYSYSLDTTVLSNGTHTFKAVATDSSSNHNTATSTTVTATVNNVTYLLEDINQNGHVDLPDFSILASNFGKTRAASSNPRADINGNGIVDLPDFSLLASKFGT
jgi:hypothetical protein